MGQKSSRLYKTGSQEIQTPQPWWQQLNSIFAFSLDAAATKDNALCRKFHTKESNGLAQPWEKSTWVNPPFRYLEQWFNKAIKEAELGNFTTMVVPFRAHTTYWYDKFLGHPQVAVYVLRRSLKFVGFRAVMPQTVVLLFFKPEGYKAPELAEERLEEMGIRHLSSPSLGGAR
jgi:hypothetical protein